MIEVYSWATPNGHKVHIMLEECALPYRAIPVDIGRGDQCEADFLRISPNNKVPVIVDEQGPGGGPFNVFESGAILLYLANKTGRLLPTEPAARSIVEQWLMVQIASVGPMFGQCSHFQRFAPPGNDYGRERYTSEVRRLFKVLEQRLAASAFLGGAEYSIADVATFPWIRTALAYFPWLAATPDGALSHYPSLQRWFAAIAARPAVQRGLEAEKRFLPLDIDAFGKADAEAIDRFCGRGRFAQA